jgi:hypothetical protein
MLGAADRVHVRQIEEAEPIAGEDAGDTLAEAAEEQLGARVGLESADPAGRDRRVEADYLSAEASRLAERLLEHATVDDAGAPAAVDLEGQQRPGMQERARCASQDVEALAQCLA